MSRTTRHLPTHNGRTFRMRGRTRSTYVEHCVHKAAAHAQAYGFFWDTIPDAERRAMRQARWDAYQEELAAWNTSQPVLVSNVVWTWVELRDGTSLRVPTYTTAFELPAQPEPPSMRVPKSRRVPVSNVEAFALYLEDVSQDAALFWDRTHRDGGIDRCGRKDRANAPSRKTQRAQARQRCREATLDGDVVDTVRWQDMLGMAEVFPRKW